MATLVRATTPTHTFVFPSAITQIADDVLITYNQSGNNIIEKRLSDLTVSGNNFSLMMSQEETKQFSPKIPIKVQARVWTTQGKALASDIYELQVQDVLNDTILQ